MNQNQQKDSLEQLLNFSFPSSSVFNVNLMKINTENFSDFKERHFCFVSMIPGEGDKTNRTYNNKNKITVKMSLREISSLSFVLEQCAKGNSGSVLPYSKFANSGAGSKQISIWVDNRQNNNTYQQQVKYNFTFAVNQLSQKINIPLSSDEVYGISQILLKIFEYGIEAEIKYQINKPKFNNKNIQPTMNMNIVDNTENSTFQFDNKNDNSFNSPQYQSQPQPIFSNQNDFNHLNQVQPQNNFNIPSQDQNSFTSPSPSQNLIFNPNVKSDNDFNNQMVGIRNDFGTMFSNLNKN